jgi:hypothetical protein
VGGWGGDDEAGSKKTKESNMEVSNNIEMLEALVGHLVFFFFFKLCSLASDGTGSGRRPGERVGREASLQGTTAKPHEAQRAGGMLTNLCFKYVRPSARYCL